MKNDYEYLYDNLGHLTGLHTRVYVSNTLKYEYKPYILGFDLVKLVHTEAFACEKTVDFFETADLLFFGKIYIPVDDVRIIIGPTTRIKPSTGQSRIILRQLSEPINELNELIAYFDSMVNYPLENFLQIICFVNYSLNNVKITVAELLEQHAFIPVIDTINKTDSIVGVNDNDAIHNTIELEREMLSYVKAGNTIAIEKLVKQPPTGRAGKMAHDDLRQQKNLIVCIATLTSRAAIAGGLSHEIAFSLSDHYIKKSELMESIVPLTSLSAQMVLDFTKHVEQIKMKGVSTAFSEKVHKLISENLDQNITSSYIASALGFSRSHLCSRFKSETGYSIGEYTTQIKIIEAKRLLESSNLTLAQISEHLGFSSQSYFQNVFKKNTGITPAMFRNKI